MYRSRVIPCLLMCNGQLWKTTRFANPKYVGDPLNTARIFSEKGADELILLDIDATHNKEEPNLPLIGQIAKECRMPLCYGGGIRDLDTILSIIQLGVEKVSLNTILYDDVSLVSRAAEALGKQSVVCCIDITKSLNTKYKYQLFSKNKKLPSGMDPVKFSMELEERGAGELLIQNVDNEGTGNGYDYDIIHEIYENVSIPVSVIGGAKDMTDIAMLLHKFETIGACAGNTFVFQGKYKSVLIQYPSASEKVQIKKGFPINK